MELNKPELLLRELKDSSFVPPYNSDLIKKLKEDFQRIHNQIDNLKKVFAAEDGSDTKYRYSFMLTLVGVLKRILRCVLAYINHRIKRIKSTFWDYAGAIPESKIKEGLSEEEKNFYNEYKNNVISYQSNLPLQLDLLKVELPGLTFRTWNHQRVSSLRCESWPTLMHLSLRKEKSLNLTEVRPNLSAEVMLSSSSSKD